MCIQIILSQKKVRFEFNKPFFLWSITEKKSLDANDWVTFFQKPTSRRYSKFISKLPALSVGLLLYQTKIGEPSWLLETGVKMSSTCSRFFVPRFLHKFSMTKIFVHLSLESMILLGIIVTVTNNIIILPLESFYRSNCL